MNKKLLIILVVLFSAIGTIMVNAITLTRDETEKVVIPSAMSGEVCLWDSINNVCRGPNEKVVFGNANVYPKGGSSVSSTMDIIIFQDKLYRSFTTGFEYYEANCREGEKSQRSCKRWKGDILEGPYKGEGERKVCEEWTTVIANETPIICGFVGLKRESGKLSLVAETGEETYGGDNTFDVSYKQDPKRVVEPSVDQTLLPRYYNDVDLELNLSNNTYKLQKVDKVLEEEIVWTPK